MRMILAVAFCTFGCGGETSKRETAAPAPNPIDSFEDARKERIEAIRKDRAGLVREAVNHVRRSAAASFGIEAAKAAKITADESGVKDHGPEKWKVEGTYAGEDEIGRRFTAPFTVTLGVVSTEISSDDVELGERKYAERPPAPPKTQK